MSSTSAVQRPRVILAEDNALIRYALRKILEQHCDVVAEADDGATAVELAEKLHPDVVLLDVSMPVLNGIEATSRIKERTPDIPVVIVSNHTEPAYVDEAFRRGAHGYVFKGSAPSQLFEAIWAALSGRMYRPA